jgi:hypothetical protein
MSFASSPSTQRAILPSSCLLPLTILHRRVKPAPYFCKYRTYSSGSSVSSARRFRLRSTSRSQPPEPVVQPALPGFGCRCTAPGTRPTFCGRADWPGGYLAYLGPQPDLSPAHSLPSSGRRSGGRYAKLAACPTGFLAAREGALENLPRQVQGGIASRIG